MYTDGADSRMVLKLDDTLTLLKASPVTVYAIGLVQNTGGQAFFLSSMKEVESAYEKVLAQIKGAGSPRLSVRHHLTDGAWRKVAIKVTRPGARVRARKSYFAPYKTSPK